MYITAKEVAQSLNIKLDYFFKLLNDLGFNRKNSFTLEELELLYLSLQNKCKRYERKLLLIKLSSFIDSCEVRYDG